MPKPSPRDEHTANWWRPDPRTPGLPGVRPWDGPASSAGRAGTLSRQLRSWAVPVAPPAGPPRSNCHRGHAPGRLWPRRLMTALDLGEVDDRGGRARAHLGVA